MEDTYLGSQFLAPEPEDTSFSQSMNKKYNEFIEGRQDPLLGWFYTARDIYHMISGNKDSDIYDSFQNSVAEKPLTDNILDGNIQQTNSASFNKPTTIVDIKNININTEDDPEKIKSALMNLIIEMQEQVNPRQVSRTIGEAPAASQSTSTDQNQNNTAQAQGTDPQSGTNNNNANSNTNTNISR